MPKSPENGFSARKYRSELSDWLDSFEALQLDRASDNALVAIPQAALPASDQHPAEVDRLIPTVWRKNHLIAAALVAFGLIVAVAAILRLGAKSSNEILQIQWVLRWLENVAGRCRRLCGGGSLQI